MEESLSRPGLTALKGVLVAVSTTALAASAAAAYYARRGWVLPDKEEGFFRAFLDLMVSFATSDQPSGAVALLWAAALAAVLSGALAGRYAARAAGSPIDRARRIARVALLGFLGSAMGIPVALGLLNAILLRRFEWSLPFLWLYGVVGAVALLPLAVVPLVAAVVLLERWTRPTGDRRSTWMIAALLVGMATVTTWLGTFAARQYATADWKLATASGAACSVQRGMSRRSVRERCGSPTDLGVERNRFTWALLAPRTCDVAVDAYNELLVLYDCREEVAGVELFAARGIHRIFSDDFDAGHRTMEHQP
jgi:MFS family permease